MFTENKMAASAKSLFLVVLFCMLQTVGSQGLKRYLCVQFAVFLYVVCKFYLPVNSVEPGMVGLAPKSVILNPHWTNPGLFQL